jgi:hypothetical protein
MATMWTGESARADGDRGKVAIEHREIHRRRCYRFVGKNIIKVAKFGIGQALRGWVALVLAGRRPNHRVDALFINSAHCLVQRRLVARE